MTFQHVSRRVKKSFCVAGAVLLPRFQKMRRIFRGRRSTLDTSDVIFRGRRSTGRIVLRVFANPIVSAARSGDKVQIPWQAWYFVTEASHETSILRSVRKKTRRKTSILKLQSVKFEEVSHEVLVLMLQHVSSRVAGFCGAVAVSMREAAKLIFVECFKTGCHAILRGRRGTL